MPALNLHRLKTPRKLRRSPINTRWWREWCFARVVFRRFRVRLLILILLLACGALLFLSFEPEKQHTFPQALYYTWSLVFGEPPEAFPRHWALQALFFLAPVVGLAIILEGIVDFALTVRDRQRSDRSWRLIMAASYTDHIVLVGLGRLGYRTFMLLRRLGEPVVVIERDPNNQFLEEVRRDGSPLFISDARRESVLADANIKQARAIVCATDDDLANLETALDARRAHPGVRVVLRMFDQNMADKIRDGFNIHIAMSQSALSAPTFAMSAIEPSIVSTVVVGDELVVTQRWKVRAEGPLCGETVGDLLERRRVSVVERRAANGERRLFPPAATRLEAGDRLIVQGAFEALIELRAEARAAASA